MNDYLPKYATIEQACDWLQAKTGQTWILPRLIESGLRPYIWLGHDPNHPAIFENLPAGYQVRVMFQDDLSRLEADGTCTLTMFYSQDGSKIITMKPSGEVPLSELKFKRDCVARVAEVINAAQAPAMPVPAAVVPTSEAKRPIDWQLIAPPERLPGYRWPLYQYLEQALKTSKPRPTAHDVFSAWRNNPPNEMTVSGTERNPVLNYKVSIGTPKIADKKAVQAAIDKLILSI
jgi:hypothetical protein